jgi:crossover junction endodeoxyribonuclease RuvC
LRPPERNSRLILGIDPGSHCCGYGVIRADGPELKHVASGAITLPGRAPLHERLKGLHEGLTGLIREFGPEEAVVEKVFFAKSARSALSLGHARGVALLAAASAGLDVYEYSALEVKKAVTGYGRAEKRQVQDMVRSILSIDGSVSADSADALALALCHMQRAWLDRAAQSI